MTDPNVFIETQDYIYHDFNYVPLKSKKLPLGVLSRPEITVFIKDLKEYRDGISECLKEFHIHLVTDEAMYKILGVWASNPTCKVKIRLEPNLSKAKCGAKRPTDCLNNIYNGKCKCEDVNKLFFERFNTRSK